MSRQRSFLRLVAVALAAAVTMLMPLSNVGAAARVSAPLATTWLPCGPLTTSPSLRSAASMAYDAATGTTVLFGGFNGGFLNDTWTWNGSGWTEMTPLSSPSPRENASVAYDAATHTVVLFGGVGPSGHLGDTWTWNGSAWTASTTAGPPPRAAASMAYDAATHTVALWGGQGDGEVLSDTWTWNGTTWSAAPASPISPPPRADASMAYEASAHDLVLYGGRGASGTLGDTWTWNGSAWTQELSASPPARYGASLVYDNTIGGLVLFGGTDGVNSFADTWLWNGTYWVVATPATQPVARSFAAMTYDPGAHNVVLFGGTDGVSDFADTWSFVTSASTPRTVRATSNADTASVVSWTPPVSDGGSAITGYVVVAQGAMTSGTGAPTCSATGITTCTVTGLANGDHYTFVVTATNAVGAGAPGTSNVAIPATVPGAPTITGEVPSRGAVTLSWVAPASTGGIPIVSYRAVAHPGGASCHVPGRSTGCVIRGLRDGSRFTFIVYATNGAGNGAPSGPSVGLVVHAVPGPPIIRSVRVVNGRVTLSWRWPVSNGGSRVVGYNIYVGPVPGGEATSPLNSRLIKGRRFSFRGRRGYRTFIDIRALTAVGTGAPSREVMVITP
ncbi:MAG: hypothetical protein HIU57_02150 [Acidobacteria bacterium]|nr:hypothetical protein [Acidobacteriota bacterium]